MLPIDFVITWVDTNDPEWVAKKNKAAAQFEQSDIRPFKGKGLSSMDDDRFRDYGTLKALFRSINKYADWVHHIYLVTDHQCPNWLDTSNNKVTVIDHEAIIPEQYLPTFNSNVVDHFLYRIPDLTEHFVYFNDDFLINKPVKPTDFFSEEGLPKDCRLYLIDHPSEDYAQITFNDTLLVNSYLNHEWPQSWKGLLSIENGIRGIWWNCREILTGAAKAGAISGASLPHFAYSFCKSSFLQAEKLWPIQYQRMFSNKFRGLTDSSISAVRSLQIESGKFAIRPRKFGNYFVLNDVDAIIEELSHPKFSLICINDAETENYTYSASKVRSALEQRYPDKSVFEKSDEDSEEEDLPSSDIHLVY